MLGAKFDEKAIKNTGSLEAVFCNNFYCRGYRRYIRKLEFGYELIATLCIMGFGHKTV